MTTNYGCVRPGSDFDCLSAYSDMILRMRVLAQCAADSGGSSSNVPFSCLQCCGPDPWPAHCFMLRGRRLTIDPSQLLRSSRCSQAFGRAGLKRRLSFFTPSTQMRYDSFSAFSWEEHMVKDRFVLQCYSTAYDDFCVLLVHL